MERGVKHTEQRLKENSTLKIYWSYLLDQNISLQNLASKVVSYFGTPNNARLMLDQFPPGNLADSFLWYNLMTKHACCYETSVKEYYSIEYTTFGLVLFLKIENIMGKNC